MKISIQKKCSFYLTFPIHGKKDLDFFLIVMMVVIFPLIRVVFEIYSENSQKCKYTFYCKKKKITKCKKNAVKFGIGHNGKSTSLYWLVTNRFIGNLPLYIFSPYLFLEFIKKILKKVNIHFIKKID